MGIEKEGYEPSEEEMKIEDVRRKKEISPRALFSEERAKKALEIMKMNEFDAAKKMAEITKENKEEAEKLSATIEIIKANRGDIDIKELYNNPDKLKEIMESSEEKEE